MVLRQVVRRKGTGRPHGRWPLLPSPLYSGARPRTPPLVLGVTEASSEVNEKDKNSEKSHEGENGFPFGCVRVGRQRKTHFCQRPAVGP